jgi:hypothetical protein
MFRQIVLICCVLSIVSDSRVQAYSSSICKKPEVECTWYNPALSCQTRICIRESGIDKIRMQLKKSIFGQEYAVNRILAHLETHSNSVLAQTANSPLVMHFVGDNGVGKSETAKIISEQSFRFHVGKEMTDQYALFYRGGSSYALPPHIESLCNIKKDKYSKKDCAMLREAHWRSLSANLHRDILTQIIKCPNSIIILNDIQSMMWEMIYSLKDIFEGIVEFDGVNIMT